MQKAMKAKTKGGVTLFTHENLRATWSHKQKILRVVDPDMNMLYKNHLPGVSVEEVEEIIVSIGKATK
jgi:hypothetical protein